MRRRSGNHSIEYSNAGENLLDEGARPSTSVGAMRPKKLDYYHDFEEEEHEYEDDAMEGEYVEEEREESSKYLSDKRDL